MTYGMLEKTQRIILDKSEIDKAQRLANLKANSNPFKQKSLPQGKLYRLGRILSQNIAFISLLNLPTTRSWNVLRDR